MLRVSIITPSFNQGKYIEETIKSVVDQTYKNIEHIIIDNESDDGTIEILKKYRHLKWLSEKDKGQTNAINKGIKMSSGEIIAWLNSDDLYYEDAVEIVVEFFQANQGIDMIYGNCMLIDEKGTEIELVKLGPFDFHKLLYSMNYIPQPSVFFKKETYNEVGPLNEDFSYAMDYEYWIRVGLKKEIAYIDQILSKFRLHNDSKTVSAKKMMDREACKVSIRYGGYKYWRFYYNYFLHKFSTTLPQVYQLFRRVKRKLVN